MTEPTDTPESELTGDGLRAARRVADVLVSEGLIAPDIFDYAIRDKDIAARLRLAALPTRKAALREGLDALLDVEWWTRRLSARNGSDRGMAEFVVAVLADRLGR